jgi:hypothetical protein
LKLKCDEPLSNFAFNFNLRRYTKVPAAKSPKAIAKLRKQVRKTKDVLSANQVGRCRLTVSKPELKARLVSALETNM